MVHSTRLAEMCELIVDCPHSTPAWTESGVIVLRSQNIRNGRLDLSNPSYTDEAHYTDRTRRAVPSEGDIVITREAPMGEVCMIPRGLRSCLGQRMVLLRPNRKNDGRFLLYALQSPSVQHEISVNEGTGSTVSNLRIPLLEALPIPSPPLAEQRAVAHILGTLDDKIELNRRMNETLEAMARAIFKSWFVDFDPVRAKAEGRETGLPQHIADLFPDRFEDSELGKIPAGWVVQDIYSVADVIYGVPFKSSSFHEDKNAGIPLIRIRDLATHDPKTFTSERHPKGYLVQPGDLIVGMDGEFRAHLWHGPSAWLNQRLCCFKPKSVFPRAYVHYQIENLLDFFERSKAGTTVIHLGKSDIDTFRVIVPNDQILAQFSEIVNRLDARILSAALQSRTLAALRDTLLPKLISGEIRVKDAERIIGSHTA